MNIQLLTSFAKSTLCGPSGVVASSVRGLKNTYQAWRPQPNALTIQKKVTLTADATCLLGFSSRYLTADKA